MLGPPSCWIFLRATMHVPVMPVALGNINNVSTVVQLVLALTLGAGSRHWKMIPQGTKEKPRCLPNGSKL